MLWHQQPSIMYDILSLANSTDLTADIPLYIYIYIYIYEKRKKSTQFMILINLSIENFIFSCLFGATTLPSDLLHSH
jgi:hypothetical protein